MYIHIESEMKKDCTSCRTSNSTWLDYSTWLNFTQLDFNQSMLMNILWLFFQPRLYLYVGTLYLPPTPTLNWLSPLFNVRYAYTRHPSSGSFHFVGSLKHQLRLSFQPAIPVSLSLPSINIIWEKRLTHMLVPYHPKAPLVPSPKSCIHQEMRYILYAALGE